ncbi:hypothetical protein FLA_0184 [Filimonas lacunae]|nr:hypothetical protein FLA_0184 [Filimonas lacunae]
MLPEFDADSIGQTKNKARKIKIIRAFVTPARPFVKPE